MSNKSKGNLLVTAQFVLIAAIVFIPTASTDELWVYIGVALCTVPGLVILFLGFRQLAGALTANPVPKAGAKLVENGIYKYVRHPIYTGLFLATLGSVVQSLSLFKLIIWLALVILITYKAAWEEKLLAETYPNYSNYLKRTGRFVPRLK